MTGVTALTLELDRGIPLPRARIMGGCSATNACFALRGAPQVYDGWAASGNPGWSFADVLADFRRLECDEDFADQWHGSDGAIPIRRHPPGEMNCVQAAFLDGAVALGHRYVDDHNRPGAVGAGPTPRNARDGVRMSTALTYLDRRAGAAEPHASGRTRWWHASSSPARERPGSASSTEPSSKPTASCSPRAPMPAR